MPCATNQNPRADTPSILDWLRAARLKTKASGNDRWMLIDLRGMTGESA